MASEAGCIRVKIVCEFFQQAYTSKSSSSVVTTTSEEFQSSLKKYAGSAEVSGGYAGVSVGVKGTWENVTDSSKKTVRGTHTANSAASSFNPETMQIIRKLTTTIRLPDGERVTQVDEQYVQTALLTKRFSMKKLDEMAVEHMKKTYDVKTGKNVLEEEIQAAKVTGSKYMRKGLKMKIGLKSKKHGEFMYVNTDKFNSDNHYVLTWMKGGHPETVNTMQFELHGYGKYAGLKNIKNDEWLYAGNAKKGDSRRVLSWIGKGTPERVDTMQWHIEDFGSYVGIKSVKYGEWMFCDKSMLKSKESRLVFTWDGKGAPKKTSTMRWVVEEMK